MDVERIDLEIDNMTRNQLQRTVKQFFARNNSINGKIADTIAQKVLADGLVSRTEKRFIRGLLKRERLDKPAELALLRLLAVGSPGSL